MSDPGHKSGQRSAARPWGEAVWRGRYVLLPLVLVVGLGVVVWVASELLPAVAPFVYTAF